MRKYLVLAGAGLLMTTAPSCGEIIGLPSGQWTEVCNGAGQCIDDATVRVCENGVWKEKLCVGGGCINGACAEGCADGNATRCSPTANIVQICSGNGVWADYMACDPSPCINGFCSSTCTPGQPNECSGIIVLRCEGGMWVTDQLCPSGCSAGACISTCVVGTLACSPVANTPVECMAGNVWQDKSPCVQSTCVNGNCVGVCAPTDKQCAGDVLNKCEGGNWVLDQMCPNGCAAGMCTTPACTVGQMRCLGNTPQSCDGNGNWYNDPPCTANVPVCQAGVCTVPPSCLGAAATCGPAGNESCCTVQKVDGGTFNRSNDPAYPATVSNFAMDRFEVTVGRFRKFVEAYPTSKPAAGAGAHPKIGQTGWDPAWDSFVPVDKAALTTTLKCNATLQTWTDQPGAQENMPMNCLSWFDAFAFCAWDGGRLPTEAEWNYAAAGGSQQRAYPWSNPPNTTTIDATYAVYNCMEDGIAGCAFADLRNVGSKSPKGDGWYAHADLGGSVWEWSLDTYATYVTPCNDCAQLKPEMRMQRGGAFSSVPTWLLSDYRGGNGPNTHSYETGVRCARDL